MKKIVFSLMAISGYGMGCYEQPSFYPLVVGATTTLGSFGTAFYYGVQGCYHLAVQLHSKDIARSDIQEMVNETFASNPTLQKDLFVNYALSSLNGEYDDSEIQSIGDRLKNIWELESQKDPQKIRTQIERIAETIAQRKNQDHKQLQDRSFSRAYAYGSCGIMGLGFLYAYITQVGAACSYNNAIKNEYEACLETQEN